VPVRPAAGWPDRCGPVPETSACRQRAPGVPGACAAVALALPFQSARAHRLWVAVFSRSRHQITKRLTCDKCSAHLLSIAAWHVDNSSFLCVHRVRVAFSQLRALSWARPGSGIPSISTGYAQAWCRCAQVIHMVVHRQRGCSPPAVLAASSGSARRWLRAWPTRRTRGSGLGLDEIARASRHRVPAGQNQTRPLHV
jgi:hypothetical protein